MAKKIYLNEGHSNTDPGAVGYEVERELVVKVGKYFEAYLEKNYTCSVKESKGTVGSLTTICNEANKWGADLFVSIHFNAGGGDGHEILVYSKDNLALGKVFDKHIKAIGQNSRGVKYRPDLGVLRLTDMKAVLVECAFVDTWKDIKDWNDNSELKKMGEAIAKATAEYLNLPKKSTKKTYSGTFPKLPSRGYFQSGDSGTQVKYLQKFLNWFGKYGLVVDGIFGEKTTSAVKKFQKAEDLTVDGLFGAKSLARAKKIKK